eukprot:SAG31_NODE_44404_length_263_cov_0.615854_1_plen_45_part_10
MRASARPVATHRPSDDPSVDQLTCEYLKISQHCLAQAEAQLLKEK